MLVALEARRNEKKPRLPEEGEGAIERGGARRLLLLPLLSLSSPPLAPPQRALACACEVQFYDQRARETSTHRLEVQSEAAKGWSALERTMIASLFFWSGRRRLEMGVKGRERKRREGKKKLASHFFHFRLESRTLLSFSFSLSSCSHRADRELLFLSLFLSVSSQRGLLSSQTPKKNTR